MLKLHQQRAELKIMNQSLQTLFDVLARAVGQAGDHKLGIRSLASGDGGSGPAIGSDEDVRGSMPHQGDWVSGISLVNDEQDTP
jgi:hypothetical protein